jgi:hypothetical protein
LKTYKIRRSVALISLFAACFTAPAQQNPSPMVEHTREHPRLAKTVPPGRRLPLELGTLFVPKSLFSPETMTLKRHEKTSKSAIKLLFFFHGGDWLPEFAAAQQQNMAVITVQAGAGSGSYVKLFAEDPARFPRLIAEAEAKSGLTFGEIDLGGWSAGCGAMRQILGDPASYDRVGGVLCIDGVHTGYVNGKPGPEESQIETDNLQNWLRLGRDAMAGKKRFILTHSEIFPGTFASTTETADYLLREWGLAAHPVVRWGPMKTQMLSEVKTGGLLVVGFAGNSAPDHVDQLHSLPEYLSWLEKK